MPKNLLQKWLNVTVSIVYLLHATNFFCHYTKCNSQIIVKMSKIFLYNMIQNYNLKARQHEKNIKTWRCFLILMSETCLYNIRKIKENALTLIKRRAIDLWLNIDRTQLSDKKHYDSRRNEEDWRLTMKKYFEERQYMQETPLFCVSSFTVYNKIFSLVYKTIRLISVKINFKCYPIVSVSTMFARLSFVSGLLPFLTFYTCEPILWFQITTEYKRNYWIWF